MQQARLAELGVALTAPRDELLLAGALLEMLVLCFLLVHRGGGHGVLAAVLTTWGIVMAGPDLGVAREVEKAAHRCEEVLGVTAGEVAAGGTDIVVEEGVSAKDVVCQSETYVLARPSNPIMFNVFAKYKPITSNLVPEMVRGMSRKMQCLRLQLADGKLFIVVEELVEDVL